MSPKREQLRAALHAIQMHAAGMHAAADLAMRLLSEMGSTESMMEHLQKQRPAGPAHYGDPGEEVGRLIEQAEAVGGEAPSPAEHAESPPQEH